MRPGKHNPALVIGVGNAYRGDDAVGPIVARKLRTKPPPHTLIREESGEGAALLESWRGASEVIIVDAVQSGGKAGTIHRFDARSQSIPSRFFHYSTHAFSVAEAIELARTLKQLPKHLIVFGIEGKNFQTGEGLSPEVEEAVERVVSLICRELDSIPSGAS